ncbi:hypothetical protein K6119_04775 [Paracrocinitomix mangrovi]|uniref:hypothetical protein n=1 Tax=Paracrocinitomix mangrovi TaxID=2862509 RepID=UPI001C8E7E24|nr:hypothetical protein [Paracrocinitomix mangrovi]UKN02829.1 hypothetical protein K6119_04775 [Paracrocinitomix mangrovi]
MKSITLTLMLLYFSVGFACDGCSVYLGLTPNDEKHNIGLYYRYRSMHGQYSLSGTQTLTKHASHGNNPNFWGNTITENYNTFELRANLIFNYRLKTYIILPFTLNNQLINNISQYPIYGFGDPVIIQSYQLIDPLKTYKNENFTQRLELGMGIKAPLGKIDKLVNNERPNLDLQPGSGSWDIIWMMKYNMKIKNTGFMSMANYKWNTMNSELYKYGNTFNFNLMMFYQTKIKSLTFLPMAGTYFENATMDESTIIHEDTGGSIYYLSGGFQLYWGKFKLFTEYQRAVKNKLNGYSQLITRQRINLGLIYNI